MDVGVQIEERKSLEKDFPVLKYAFLRSTAMSSGLLRSHLLSTGFWRPL